MANFDIGDDFKILNFSLDTNWLSITTTAAFRSCYIQEKDGGAISVRRSATDTTPFTLAAGGLKISNHRIPDSGATITICQVSMATGTGTLEVILTL